MGGGGGVRSRKSVVWDELCCSRLDDRVGIDPARFGPLREARLFTPKNEGLCGQSETRWVTGRYCDLDRSSHRVNKQIRGASWSCRACEYCQRELSDDEDRRTDHRWLQELCRAHNHRQMGCHLQRHHRKHPQTTPPVPDLLICSRVCRVSTGLESQTSSMPSALSSESPT